MNIECDNEALSELESAFRFNDAVLRNMIIRREEAITEASQLAKSQDEDDNAPSRQQETAAEAPPAEEQSEAEE
jgi:small subunit ribosomal protein S6